ncbi:ComEC/Rec2-related protein [Rhodobacteraceae bacterium HIMB11]|nr:ComEC/Rec2-related protein [Rhodobacteraceae bacterium HIMB11]
MPERSLGFAQAIISGDRLNLSLQVIEDLRRTNLAHLLAISGLHMGLLMTVVFGLLRMICVVIPIGHIRWHARSIAAFGAIMAGVAYLGLLGNSIATQRAFVMIACFFGGVILPRRALTLRSLALAALIILALRPEALYSPGFQMSFAANIALALSPLHLAPVGFWLVDLGLIWIQFIAGYLAEFELAVRMIKTPMDWVLPYFHLVYCGVFCGAGNMEINWHSCSVHRCGTLDRNATTRNPNCGSGPIDWGIKRSGPRT